jgi:outer membrane biosynthesis protein TonB
VIANQVERLDRNCNARGSQLAVFSLSLSLLLLVALFWWLLVALEVRQNEAKIQLKSFSFVMPRTMVCQAKSDEVANRLQAF